jgi:hypothetical protein
LTNQPFDFPRSKAQDLLRVDTEQSILPHLKEHLALSKYQKFIWPNSLGLMVKRCAAGLRLALGVKMMIKP